jgi:hypothetical protein
MNDEYVATKYPLLVFQAIYSIYSEALNKSFVKFNCSKCIISGKENGCVLRVLCVKPALQVGKTSAKTGRNR